MKGTRQLSHVGNTRSFRGLYLALILVCTLLTAGATSYEAHSRAQLKPLSFWVTLDVDGTLIRSEVRRQDSIRYLLDYVAGLAPRKIPRGLVIQAEGQQTWTFAPESLVFTDPSEDQQAPPTRILSVEGCNRGKCTKLPGIYAGRSPY